MKKIITLIALALACITLKAEEVSKTDNLTLVEVAGVYSLKSSTGILVLGDMNNALETLLVMEKRFTCKKASEVFEFDDTKYKVSRDEVGLYITKVGLGIVKIRPWDATKFSGVLAGKAGWRGLKSIYTKVENFVKDWE